MPDRATPVEVLRGLAVLAEPPGSEHVRLAEVLGLPSVPTASEYSDVFLFQLYPYASVHLGAEGMMGGDARERVAGFWRALGHTPPAEPDHLVALLGLYVALTEQVQTAGTQDGGPDEAELVLVAQARVALMREHLAPWVFPFLSRVEELAPGPYGTWAALLTEVLRSFRWHNDPHRDVNHQRCGECAGAPKPRLVAIRNNYGLSRSAALYQLND